MAVTVDPAERRRSDVDTSESVAPWARSLWFHGVLLATLLVVLIPVIGLRGQLNNDEGSALVQARQLAEHGTWFVPNRFAQADPLGQGYALERSTHTDQGFAPLLKHPAYPLVLSVVDRFHGRVGIALLGVFGTIVAALAAALIARELHPRLTLWTLWVTGISSPLFFDAYIVIAHSLAAAGIGVAGLGAVRYLEKRGWVNLILVACGLAWANLLRAEALLLGVALSAVLALVAVRVHRRDRQLAARHVVVGAVAGTASVLAFLTDRAAVKALAPTVLASNAFPLASAGYLADRLNALMLNWFRFTYNEDRVELLGPLLLGTFSVVLAVGLRRRSGERAVWLVTVAALWIGSVSWFAFAKSALIPGLLPAFPLLIVALVACTRAVFDDRRVAVLAGTFALFALAVLATEYSIAGALEWGARYLAIGLPLITPVVVVIVDHRYRRMHVHVRRLSALALVPLLIAPAAVSTKVLRSNHAEWASVADQVIARARVTNPGDAGKPVIVTNDITMPRFVSSTMDQARWLALTDRNLDPVVARMHRIGIEQFLFVTQDRSVHLGNGYTTRSCRPFGTRRINYNACVIVRTTER